MQDILEEINRITKGNVIFTGSYSEKIQGVPIEKVGDLDIIVKDSMLEVFPFPFLSMSRFLFSKVLGRSREKLTLNDIEIAIV